MQIVPDRLAKSVEDRGGLAVVQEGNLWNEVAHDVGLELDNCSADSLDSGATVRRIYFK